MVRTPHGLIVGRCDFYWDEPGVFGEADGRSKYDGRDVLTAEKDRQEALERLGLVCVRWGWSTVRSDPRDLAARVLDAFERDGCATAPVFPANGRLTRRKPTSSGEKRGATGQSGESKRG